MSKVTVDKREFERLQAIEAAARAFADAVERVGAAPAIAQMLNKTPRPKEGRS